MGHHAEQGTGLVSSHHTIPSPLQLCHELTASPSPQGYTGSCGFWGKNQALPWPGAEDPLPPPQSLSTFWLVQMMHHAPPPPQQKLSFAYYLHVLHIIYIGALSVRRP